MAYATYFAGGNTHWAPSITFAFGDPVPTADAKQFVIQEPDPASATGPGGYSIHLYSVLIEPPGDKEDGNQAPDNDGDEVGTFAYNEGSKIPNAGTIDYIEIQDNTGAVYLKITGPFHDPSLVDFLSILQSSGAKAALDNLVGDNLILTGSGQTDYAETYGQFGTYHLGGGNSFLDITYSNTTAYADGGSDTFIIDRSGLVGLQLHGGLTDGTVAPGEVSTLDFHVAGRLAFATIDGFSSFQFTAPGDGGQFNQCIYLNVNQLPGGATPVFHVTGSTADHANEIVIEPSGSGAQYVDLSNVTTTNFTRSDQSFLFDFGDDTSNDTAIGVPNAHNVFHLGSGNDLAISGSLADVFIGGLGNDTFQIIQSGFFSGQLHGGLADGTIAPGEVNTLDFHVAGTLAFATIDGFNSFLFSAPGDGGQFDQFIYLNVSQLPGGATPVFHVTGSTAEHANEIVIVPSGGGAQHVDLSNVTVSNFTMRFDQAFWFYFAGDKTNDTMIGAPNARNVFQVGSGNDRAIGGHLADVFIAGHGHDYFNGRGGIDIAEYHAGIGHYTVTKLRAHTYRVHDNRHGSPDGTDTLVNVEDLKFTNATEFIGGNVPVITVGAGVHAHDLAPAPAHHFDLFA